MRLFSCKNHVFAMGRLSQAREVPSLQAQIVPDHRDRQGKIRGAVRPTITYNRTNTDTVHSWHVVAYQLAFPGSRRLRHSINTMYLLWLDLKSVSVSVSISMSMSAHQCNRLSTSRCWSWAFPRETEVSESRINSPTHPSNWIIVENQDARATIALVQLA